MTTDQPALDMLSLSITHELRESLSVIVGYADLLAMRPWPEEERDAFVGRIRRATARMVRSLERLERDGDPGRLRFGPNGERELLDLRVA